MKRKKGFTLIELICVLFIIGILSTWFFPKISLLKGYKVNSFSRGLYQDILDLKVMNINDEFAELYVSKDRYVIYDGDRKVIKTKKISQDIVVGWHIKFTNHKHGIRFTRAGHPIKAGSIWIYNKKNLYLNYITIMPYTGKVRLYKEKNSEEGKIKEIKEKIRRNDVK